MLRKRLFYNAKPMLLPCKTAAFGTQNNRFCNTLMYNELCNSYFYEKYLHYYYLLFIHEITWIRYKKWTRILCFSWLQVYQITISSFLKYLVNNTLAQFLYPTHVFMLKNLFCFLFTELHQLFFDKCKVINGFLLILCTIVFFSPFSYSIKIKL